jgi:rod shape-determining protein MreB
MGILASLVVLGFCWKPLMRFLASYFGSILYVQLSPERLSVRNPRSGKYFSEIPEVAIAFTPKAKIMAFGTKARLAAAEPGVQIFNPFAHPRTLVSDFTLGEQLLKACFFSVNQRAWWAMAPQVVMHPLGEQAGGLTQVEIRAFHEMALGAGASEVRVWQGRSLTDAELLSGTFPADGTLLS